MKQLPSKQATLDTLIACMEQAHARRNELTAELSQINEQLEYSHHELNELLYHPDNPVSTGDHVRDWLLSDPTTFANVEVKQWVEQLEAALETASDQTLALWARVWYPEGYPHYERPVIELRIGRLKHRSLTISPAYDYLQVPFDQSVNGQYYPARDEIRGPYWNGQDFAHRSKWVNRGFDLTPVRVERAHLVADPRCTSFTQLVETGTKIKRHVVLIGESDDLRRRSAPWGIGKLLEMLLAAQPLVRAFCEAHPVDDD